MSGLTLDIFLELSFNKNVKGKFALTIYVSAKIFDFGLPRLARQGGRDLAKLLHNNLADTIVPQNVCSLMRYGIFSDVHSNLPALEAVLNSYAQEQIDRYVCIGDIVGYAANPQECIAKIKDLNPVWVAGNHDWASADLFSTENFNPIAREAVEWTKAQLSLEEKRFLSSPELVFNHNDFILVHGTLDNAEDFNYLYDQMDAQVTFELMVNQVCFVGHTHIPGIFTMKNNHIAYLQQYPLQIAPQNKYIVNVGSVGQPRDRNYQACYCVFDTKSQMIEIKRVDYDIKEAQNRIIAAGLPSFLAERLSLGR